MRQRPSPSDSSSSTGPSRSPDAEPRARARERLPDPGTERFDEQDLRVAAGRPLRVQAGRHDLRVVDDDELSVELVRQVGDGAVADRAGGALEDEEP